MSIEMRIIERVVASSCSRNGNENREKGAAVDQRLLSAPASLVGN